MRLIDAENFEAFDSTLPIQIAPKGMRARKIASFFYAEGCKRVLESIDAASTIDPESLQPTSYVLRPTSYVLRPTGRASMTVTQTEIPSMMYCPNCGARMEDPDHD